MTDEHYLEVAKECGACTLQQPNEELPYSISFGPEELAAYTARICAEKDAEIAAQKESWNDLRGFLERTQKELSAANAAIAMKDEALKPALAYVLHVGCNQTEKGLPHPQQQLVSQLEKALSTSPESIAAWEEQKLLPLQQEIERLRKFELTSPSQMELQRQVAMLRELLNKFEYNEFGVKRYPFEQSVYDALSDTQATAEAYDREHAAKVRSVALEDVGAMIAVGATINELSDYVLKELRAANKKEGE